MKRIIIIFVIVLVIAVCAYLLYTNFNKTKNVFSSNNNTAKRLILYDDIKHINRDKFQTKVKQISKKLDIDPNWLQAVMWKESRIDSSVQNSTTNATGLIQFMPATAGALGTTVADLKSMDPVQQLDYVYKYYDMLGMTGKMKSYSDLYMATFFPAAVGWSDDSILKTSQLKAETVAGANPGIDLNKDKKITVAEFKKYCLKGLPTNVIQYVK